jgi:hypothetical protein
LTLLEIYANVATYSTCGFRREQLNKQSTKRKDMYLVSFTLSLVLNACVALEVIFAYQNKMALPSQMRSNGHQYGLPIIGHGGIWGDPFLITPSCVLFVALYGNQWSLTADWKLIGIAWIATAVFHWIWAQGKDPDCLIGQKNKRQAFWVHFIYMGITLSVILMTYFGTTKVNSRLLILTSAILSLHIALGNHVVLSIIKPYWWNKNILKDPGACIVIVGVWIALFWRSRYMITHGMTS